MGQLTPGPHPSELSDEALAFYELRGKLGKRTEALAKELADGAGQLEVVRNRIALGELEEAEGLLARWSSESALSEYERIEYLLEAARLAFYQGKFGCAAAYATQVADHANWPLSRLTALQVRIAAGFELQRWADVSNDLTKAEALCLIYPDAPVANGVRAFRVRYEIRKREMLEGRKLLDAWLAEMESNGILNLDLLHQWERIRLDWLRIHGEPSSKTALKTFFYARALNEKFFEASAAFDCWTTYSEFSRRELSDRLDNELRPFARLRDLRAQLGENPSGATETARAILNYWSVEKTESFGPEATQADPDFLLDRDLLYLVSIKKGTLIDLKNKLQLFHALVALAAGTIDKKSLFSKVWPGLPYNPETRDGVLRALLKRLRRDLNLRVSSQMGSVSLESRVLIL